MMTLFRLALNISATRLILLSGQPGSIITAFGQFVVGGNEVVGLVIFLILVIIQFIVITKGAERISEVSARFTLDAMPGKQMSIDADLNAGLIDETTARQRRQKIVRESEFYGAMDGASKFIRGDAVASLIITAVNLVGGFAIGMARGMTAGESVTTYSILGIGDGLVTQIPAVIISTASGFLITKTSTQSNISQDLVRQVLARSRPLGIAAFLLGAMVFVPGFPKAPFVILALVTAGLARVLSRHEKQTRQARQAKPQAEAEQAPVEELLDTDALSIQVGARLIRTVDPRRKDSLTHRIAPLRRKFAQNYGIVLPLVRLRDSVTMDPNTYEIRLYNHVIGMGRLEPEKFLAMDGGAVTQEVPGQAAREPVFNLPALWIEPAQKEQAELGGYTVVDPESVLVTHLSEALRRHAYELLSRDDVQKLVDRLGQKHPALVKEVVGEMVPLGLLRRVLQNLLRDGVPIRDLAQIVEALGDHAGRTKDPRVLTEQARKALARAITEQYVDREGRVRAIVLAPAMEYELCGALTREGNQESLNLPPERALELARRIAEAWKGAMEQGHDRVVLLCDGRLRPFLAEMTSRQVPHLPVLAYDEIASGTTVDPVESIAQGEPSAALPAGVE